jgi:hypothetical protein
MLGQMVPVHSNWLDWSIELSSYALTATEKLPEASNALGCKGGLWGAQIL